MTDLRVLIAEDDEDLRSALRDLFLERGARVWEAASGFELTQLLSERGPFDLVVTDVRMSWATGAQVLGMARLAGLDTPFLVITGHRDEELARAVREQGAVLLYKPVSLDTLMATAEKLVLSLRRRPGGPSAPGPGSRLASA